MISNLDTIQYHFQLPFITIHTRKLLQCNLNIYCEGTKKLEIPMQVRIKSFFFTLTSRSDGKLNQIQLRVTG